ncbi:snare complex subunit [Botryosphaeria dothidea]|uniref:Snare complex subunit n=1 Tax=Botryosphaeria dothidea TaxID=55169 RepID=A0A8H4IRI2_9PEZI|nr:snare complex subunit [Botryosphaeria dothidea]KAF4306060.1 snare complex subunit [Botryosphaeria dothidea]
MWRDRTNLSVAPQLSSSPAIHADFISSFISYRQSYSHHPAKRKPLYGGPSNGYADNAALSDERRGLMSAFDDDNNGDAVIEMDVLPPRWLDIQDEVTERLQDIAKQTKRLDQLHQKHVLPGFDDEDVKKREEREIERLTQEITRGFQSCQQAIKRIDAMLRESAQREGGASKGEEVMARNLKVSLASRISESSAAFRKKQSAYLKKLRALGGLSSPSRIGSPGPQNPYTDPSLQESYDDTSLSRATLQQTAQVRSHVRKDANEAIIAQREREIDEIAKGIIDLASIFQELQTMVIDQGSMLDRIDYNVERMATDVKAADKELTVATNYQRRTVKRKAMLLLVILIAGAFILLGLKLGSRSSSSSASPPPVVPPFKPEPPIVPEPPTDPDSPAEHLGIIDGKTALRRAADAPDARGRERLRRRKRRLWEVRV